MRLHLNVTLKQGYRQNGDPTQGVRGKEKGDGIFLTF
jgi:hypothetical protein